jgi:hypothetical protein
MPDVVERRLWRVQPHVRLSVGVFMVLVLVVGCGLGWVIRGRLKEAEAAYREARAARRVAEAAVVEYRDGIYKQERETTVGEVARALAMRKSAEDRIVWSDRMFQKNALSKAQNIADKIALQQRVFAYEQAVTKLDVLEKYTRDKTIKELQSEVKKATSNELAKQAVYERLRTPRLAWPW